MSDLRVLTSESVSVGHPDKLADCVSDAILDAVFEQHPGGRVACETLVKAGVVVLAGEVTTTAKVDHAAVIREVIMGVGYDDEATGFDGGRCAVMLALNDQSPDISRGVSEGCGLDLEQGAGDQGMVFGFACRETPSLMPLPIQLAHQLMIRQEALRNSGRLGWLRPDAKSQVSVRYEGTQPVAVDTVVLSTQHSPDIAYKTLRESVVEEIVRPVLPQGLETAQTRFLVNPTGRFVLGGPYADCGLTGRKIIVDTYGGAARHGGGAFSGKDPSKIDRSGAYAARYVAKNIVAAGLAETCEVQIAYAIGIARPVALRVDTFGTAVVSEPTIEALVQELFDLRPKGIIQMLDLLRPIYRKTASHGHFGREDPAFTWEKTDRAEALRREAEVVAA